MYVILSPSHHFHTGDWNEEKPECDPSLEKAYQHATKEIALDAIRARLAADKLAERAPSFAGFRVSSTVLEVLRLLKKRDVNAKATAEAIVVTVEPQRAAAAKKEFSAAIAGVKIGLVTTLGQVIR